MSSYKSREYIESDSSSDEDSPVETKKPPKAAKKKSVEKSSKREKEKKVKSSKVKKEKRKRELSPPSEPDSPPRKIEKTKPRPKAETAKVEKPKKGKQPRDPDSVCADVSDMKNIGLNRYVGILEFKGKKYLNIREYYEDSHGLKPGKKGVSLVRDQWNNLVNSFFEIDEKMFTATDEDFSPIDLGKNKRVRVTKFKGKWLLIDIREVYMKEGEEMPGKKGIALKPEQYQLLKGFQEEIDQMW